MYIIYLKRDCFVANAPRNDRMLKANAPRNDGSGNEVDFID